MRCEAVNHERRNRTGEATVVIYWTSDIRPCCGEPRQQAVPYCEECLRGRETAGRLFCVVCQTTLDRNADISAILALGPEPVS